MEAERMKRSKKKRKVTRIEHNKKAKGKKNRKG